MTLPHLVRGWWISGVRLLRRLSRFWNRFWKICRKQNFLLLRVILLFSFLHPENLSEPPKSRTPSHHAEVPRATTAPRLEAPVLSARGAHNLYGDFTAISPTRISTKTLFSSKHIEFHPSGKIFTQTSKGFFLKS